MDVQAAQPPAVATAVALAGAVPPPAPAPGEPEAPAPAVEPSAAGRHGPWAAGHARLVDQLRSLAAHQAARLVAAGGVAHVPGTNPPRLVAVPIGSPALTLTVALPDAPAPREVEPAPASAAPEPAGAAEPRDAVPAPRRAAEPAPVEDRETPAAELAERERGAAA